MLALTAGAWLIAGIVFGVSADSPATTTSGDSSDGSVSATARTEPSLLEVGLTPGVSHDADGEVSREIWISGNGSSASKTDQDNVDAKNDMYMPAFEDSPEPRIRTLGLLIPTPVDSLKPRTDPSDSTRSDIFLVGPNNDGSGESPATTSPTVQRLPNSKPLATEDAPFVETAPAEWREMAPGAGTTLQTEMASESRTPLFVEVIPPPPLSHAPSDAPEAGAYPALPFPPLDESSTQPATTPSIDTPSIDRLPNVVSNVPPPPFAMSLPETRQVASPVAQALREGGTTEESTGYPIGPRTENWPVEPKEIAPEESRRYAMVQQADPFIEETPRPAGTADVDSGISRTGPFEVIDHTEEMSVVMRRSKLLRATSDVYRVSIVDENICDVRPFTPREVSIMGKSQGATHVTFWFDNPNTRPITFLVRVVPDPEVQERREEQYGLLEEQLAELFPNSKVRLIPMLDKLIVKGQARDSSEAHQILTFIRGEAAYGRRNQGGGYGGWGHGGHGSIAGGTAVQPFSPEEVGKGLPASHVVNMLRIPGVQQVMLRVKIAELDRSAAREFGVDLGVNLSDGDLIVRTLLNAATGNASSILGTLNQGEIQFGIHYLEQHGVVRLLSEPTLVAMSGRPASFISGGEIAVPTTVSVGGAGVATTDFRAYGALLSFLPTVIDKDHIRLEVAPEFSQLDPDSSVGGISGMKTRAVTTTVEMREGQTLAIAGLLDDSMTSNTQGNIPMLARLLGQRSVTRNETELLILVTPELVHPMDPEEVPPLPGFDVTEPTNARFILAGDIEGHPLEDYRSTVWPRLSSRYPGGGSSMISGPYGHCDSSPRDGRRATCQP